MSKDFVYLAIFLCILRNFGMTLGVRDSRKIIGRHNLTADEVIDFFKYRNPYIKVTRCLSVCVCVCEIVERLLAGII